MSSADNDDQSADNGVQSADSVVQSAIVLHISRKVDGEGFYEPDFIRNP
ncbi:hypothetical protein ACIQXV_07870 [Neobacillus sp. NPDC097160]